MPAKNTVKVFAENSFYHIYNRGVNKTNIFIDFQDYQTFLHLLEIYLIKDYFPITSKRSLYGRAEVLAYCLMPNHFHLLVRQKDKVAMTELIRKICTIYSMNFNQKYKRVGPLFQGKYKAALLDTNRYLLYVSKYIHQNPMEILQPNQTIYNYPYSSLQNYVGNRNQEWLKTDFIKDLLKDEFGSGESYDKFIKDASSPMSLNQNIILD